MRAILIRFLTLIIMIFACSSCSDKLLEEDLYSTLVKDNLPQSVVGAQQLVDGIYPSIQYFSYYSGNQWLITVESGTDEFFLNWGGLPETGWGGRQNFLNLNAIHPQPLEMWNNVYQLIAQSNEALNNFKELASENEEVEKILAEATFWRAYAYYKLQSVFGDVPLIVGNEDLTDGIERTDKREILDFVEEEMLKIEKILPPSRSEEDYGRPTSYAVKAFLARYYLNTKEWRKASKYAKDVIDNGGFLLMGDYESVFSIDGNSEIILPIVHVAESNKGNKYVALSLDTPVQRALGINGVSASNGYGMSVPFFESFDTNDLRRKDYNPANKRGIMVHGVVRDSDGISAYKNSSGKAITVQKAINRVLSFKFPVEENIPNGEDSGHDFPLMRLAEVYLTYAEAQVELGNSGEALNYINRIRARAGITPLSITDKEYLRDAILAERGWELYHEGYRREDLIRHGVLLNKIEAKWNYYFENDFPYSTDEFRKLLPIPSSALINNPLLTQNPGY